MNLKINQIIKNKDGSERKVLEVFTNTVVLSDNDDFEQTMSLLWTEKELLDNDYIIPIEAWQPKIGEMYWYINQEGEVYYTNWWSDDLKDNNRKNFLGVYESESSAQKALEEIKSRLNKVI